MALSTDLPGFGGILTWTTLPWYAETQRWNTKMATDLTQENEVEAFQRFLRERSRTNGSYTSLEGAVEAFRAYQQELERFRRDTQPSLEESARGESSELDIDDVIARGRDRLAPKGITD